MSLKEALADQANVILKAVDERFESILEAVDERMDKKLDKKFGEVIGHVDAVVKELQAHREEDVIGAKQLRRHDDRLQDHETKNPSQ